MGGGVLFERTTFFYLGLSRKIPEEMNAVLFLIHKNKSRLRHTLLYCTNVLHFPGTILFERSLQLEINCGRTIGRIPFLFSNGHVKLNEFGFLKFHSCFYFIIYHMMIRNDQFSHSINVFGSHYTS